MARYKIWDKTSNVFTPSGEVFTPEQWKERYPVANFLDIVCDGGVMNGAFFGVYDQMIEMYESTGCNFEGCNTKQEHLERIEQYENERNNPTYETVITPEERIAAALEAQVMMSMMDVED